MTELHHRKIKIITFTLGGNSFECAVKSWKVVNNTPDGERLYAQCPDSDSMEDGEPDYALELTFWSDWRLAGISDYLWSNNNAVVAYVLDHLPDIPGEHIRLSGTCKIKRPPIGGDVRTTEMTEVTLPIFGEPAYTRP